MKIISLPFLRSRQAAAIRAAVILLIGIPSMALALTTTTGCNGNAAKGAKLDAASFSADPSKMSPETRRRMEEAMRGGQQSAPPAGAPGAPTDHTPAPAAKP